MLVITDTSPLHYLVLIDHPAILLLLAACWGVVVLSAVSAAAGAGGNGVRLNGLSLNGVSKSGVGKSDGLRDSVAQGVTAP